MEWHCPAILMPGWHLISGSSSSPFDYFLYSSLHVGHGNAFHAFLGAFWLFWKTDGFNWGFLVTFLLYYGKCKINLFNKNWIKTTGRKSVAGTVKWRTFIKITGIVGEAVVFCRSSPWLCLEGGGGTGVVHFAWLWKKDLGGSTLFRTDVQYFLSIHKIHRV